jgi:hypothetical protein
MSPLLQAVNGGRSTASARYMLSILYRLNNRDKHRILTTTEAVASVRLSFPNDP